MARPTTEKQYLEAIRLEAADLFAALSAQEQRLTGIDRKAMIDDMPATFEKIKKMRADFHLIFRHLNRLLTLAEEGQKERDPEARTIHLDRLGDG